MFARRLLILAPTLLLLAGCDIPGLGPDPKAVQREADAKATGGACRYAQRGIEDCYTLNPKAPKSAVFDGWKEMDQYMRDNKIEGAPSVIPIPAAAPPEGSENKAAAETEEPKPKKGKGSDKH
ncbi:hypothetical protein [Curvibacter gracilis]|uniref:hypothetical protein n=1 Tax=Curvibacter gracilis TaxID=230310 RepID=UPI0004886DA7|nr:hypothetical protein [Curvibacter gracilis]